MTDNVLESDYPVWALLPKRETGVNNFLEKYPEYDGRGIIIAIFDSGVDPGAPGLQRTSDGKIKVIERFDCSGCGDVDTSITVTPRDGFIIGLSGKKLKIPETWTNPTNNYRIGVKRVFDLYPENLRERYMKENKEANWNNQHKAALAQANLSLSKLDSSSTDFGEFQKLAKEDCENTVEILNNFEKKYNDLGPVYDCVLFHDGTKWVACVDTTEKGNLGECTLLGEYSITHEYARLTDMDSLNYSINVHNGGNILELVGLCSSHGTHVASIASAYFPDEPHLNGIAPGAQLVSLTIGDGRLGSMETGTALVRAMIKVMELQETNPIHVINMSYGEHAHWSNSGRIGELMNEVVNKYGIVWVASVGNHGPALSTIGTPPDISQETIIGVGAYVSPEMMIAEYSMRQKLPGTSYTWSSRGPTIEGGFGVSVCAPGGAITSVPHFTLTNSQLMSGTSMASPHVAGAVGIMLSGLKQRGVPYSSYNIKRVLENTALKLADVECQAQGRGLVQVDKCFEHLITYSSAQERDVRFHISCSPNNTKGIYIRNKLRSNNIEACITIEPFFQYSKDVHKSTTRKLLFNMKLTLKCKARYVDHPSYLDLSNIPRSFCVKIDMMGLPVGVHSTSIDAYDATCVEKGPVFRIPITVIQAQEIAESTYTASFYNISFPSNTVKRHFFGVPDRVTWAVIKLKSRNSHPNAHFIVHCMQILPKHSCRTLELNKHITISSNNDCNHSFPVKGSLVLEVVVAKFWTNIGEVVIDYEISFYGIKPSQPNITMLASDGIYSLEVTSFRGEEILPSITLRNSVQVLKPTESKTAPLTNRDVIPPSKQIYELNLTYVFHLKKATEVCPINPLLSDVLYESEFESQLWMLFDYNKQFLGCGDAYPSKYSIKLSKGDYAIKMHIRHDIKGYLDKLADMPLLLNQKLPNIITLDMYSSYSQAIIGDKKPIFSQTLSSSTVPLYIAPLLSSKFIPKNHNTAQYLTGYVTYAKDELGKRADFYPVKYILCESGKKYSGNKVVKDKSKFEEFKDTLKELKIQWVSKLEPQTTTDELYNDLLKEHPECIEMHTAYLQCIDPFGPKTQLPSIIKAHSTTLMKPTVKKFITICDQVLNQVDQEKLLAYFSIKVDLRRDAFEIKARMEHQRTTFIEALCRKGIYLCSLLEMGHIMKGEAELPSGDDLIAGISEIWHVLLKFIDPVDSKVTNMFVLYFALWHSVTKKQYGRALKYLMRIQEEKSSKDIEERIVDVCRMSCWNHLVLYLQRNILSKFPTAFKPF
ncbi:hypothetical protein Trydic_g15333 [Trypoxylus dichotomus]